LTLVASSGAAAVPGPSWSVTVTRSPGALGCTDEGALSARLRALAPPGGASSADPLLLSVTFTREADGRFVAKLVVEGKQRGERLLEDRGPTCAALSEAVAVASSLLLEEDREQAEATERASARSSEGPARATRPPPTPSAEGRDDASARAAGADDAPSRVAARVVAEAGPSYGVGSALSALGTVRAGARTGGVVLDLGLGGVLPRTQEFAQGGVRTSLWFGTARGCYLMGGERLAVGPCAAVAVGRLGGVGHGYVGARRADLTFVALAGSLLAEARLGRRLFAVSSLGVWVPTQQRTFSVQGAGIAWESPTVGGSLGLGLGARVF
jgi:hypothetical protein